MVAAVQKRTHPSRHATKTKSRMPSMTFEVPPSPSTSASLKTMQDLLETVMDKYEAVRTDLKNEEESSPSYLWLRDLRERLVFRLDELFERTFSKKCDLTNLGLAPSPSMTYCTVPQLPEEKSTSMEALKKLEAQVARSLGFIRQDLDESKVKSTYDQKVYLNHQLSDRASELNQMLLRKQGEAGLNQQVKPGASTSESSLADSASSGETSREPRQDKAQAGTSFSKNDPSQKDQQRKRDKRRKYKDKKKAKKETTSGEEDVQASQVTVEPADFAEDGEQIVASPAFGGPSSSETEAPVEILQELLNQADGKSVALQGVFECADKLDPVHQCRRDLFGKQNERIDELVDGVYLKEVEQSGHAEPDASESFVVNSATSGETPIKVLGDSTISVKDTSSGPRKEGEQETASAKEAAENPENGPASEGAETKREESAEALSVDTVTVAHDELAEFLTEQERFMEALDGEASSMEVNVGNLQTRQARLRERQEKLVERFKKSATRTEDNSASHQEVIKNAVSQAMDFGKGPSGQEKLKQTVPGPLRPTSDIDKGRKDQQDVLQLSSLTGDICDSRRKKRKRRKSRNKSAQKREQDAEYPEIGNPNTRGAMRVYSRMDSGTKVVGKLSKGSSGHYPARNVAWNSQRFKADGPTRGWPPEKKGFRNDGFSSGRRFGRSRWTGNGNVKSSQDGDAPRRWSLEDNHFVETKPRMRFKTRCFYPSKDGLRSPVQDGRTPVNDGLSGPRVPSQGGKTGGGV